MNLIDEEFVVYEIMIQLSCDQMMISDDAILGFFTLFKSSKTPEALTLMCRALSSCEQEKHTLMILCH
jgi:hypothetical protein